MSNGEKFEFVIVNLKVLAQIPRNRRLRTTTNGYFTLEDNHLLVPIRRTLYGEGRDKLIRDIKSLLAEVQAQMRHLLTSKHLSGEDSDDNESEQKEKPSANTNAKLSVATDEKRIVLEQLSSIHRELERSITGFENLKSTYVRDILMVGELDHIIDTVRLYMNEIEQKIPDVSENISPVLLEKS